MALPVRVGSLGGNEEERKRGQACDLWDSNNRQTSTYAYDGDGRRVLRNIVGTETWQVYGVGGELLAEYAANVSASSPQKEYGYRNGQLLVTASSPDTVWVEDSLSLGSRFALTSIACPKSCYDATGNLINDTINTYTFNAEHKILKVDGTTACNYDGEGQRERKLVGENTRFICDIGGQLFLEFDGSAGNPKKEDVHGGGTMAMIAPNENP